MKRILTLVLCWLIAFSAMAETTLKAKTALSAAGGYVTSLNKVDGSFEDGTAGWIASTDNIVQTASTEFQGNYKGVWSGTGAGTLDLQWTATASNTYEASAQVNVQGEDDVYVCAYVGTTETGCKLIPALNKIQKVSVVADSVISSAFYLRLKHTGSDAFSVDIDDGKIEPWTPQAVNLVQEESVSFKGTGLLTTTGTIKFPTSGFNRQWSNLASYDQSTGRLTATKNIVLNGSVSLLIYSVATRFYVHKNGSLVNISNTTPNSNNFFATVSFSIQMNAGDYVTIETDGGISITQSSLNSFSITATAISDNVVQSWQDGTEWTDVSSLVSFSATTYSGLNARAKRSGSNLEVIGSMTVSAYSASTLQFNLPWGLSTKAVSQITPIEGYYKNSAVSTLNGVPLINSSRSFITFGFPTAVLVEQTSNAINSPGTVAFSFVIPIQGWSSTPTLLALPTSKENVFSAKISSTGTRTGQNIDWINSVTVSDTSLYTIDITKLGLSVPPQVNANITGTWTTSNAPRWATVQSVSSSSIVIRTHSLSAGVIQYEALPFEIKIQKQSPDYTAPGVFVGSLAKDYTAYVDASEVITNATDNFITSCTNADPTVCTFASTKFGTAPYCNAQKTSSADVYVTTTSTTSVTIERADSSSPFSLFCQIK